MSPIPNQTLLLASKAHVALHRFSFLFPKPPAEARIVCISTAANVYQETAWLEEEKNGFRQLGFRLKDFDIADKTKAEVAGALNDSEIVYVTGGNTYYLLEKINQSGFAEVLKDRLGKGALYIGSSAGAIVACPDIAFIEDMDDPHAASLTDYTGMGLTDFVVLPHIDHPKYGPVARTIAAKAGHPHPMIGLRDDQAIVVRGSYAEIY